VLQAERGGVELGEAVTPFVAPERDAE